MPRMEGSGRQEDDLVPGHWWALYVGCTSCVDWIPSICQLFADGDTEACSFWKCDRQKSALVHKKGRDWSLNLPSPWVVGRRLWVFCSSGWKDRREKVCIRTPCPDFDTCDNHRNPCLFSSSWICLEGVSPMTACDIDAREKTKHYSIINQINKKFGSSNFDSANVFLYFFNKEYKWCLNFVNAIITVSDQAHVIRN